MTQTIIQVCKTHVPNKSAISDFNEDRVVENLQLLYLQRYAGDIWHKGKLDESTVRKG